MSGLEKQSCFTDMCADQLIEEQNILQKLILRGERNTLEEKDACKKHVMVNNIL